MLTNREVILVEIEGTYNTDANPNSTDAVLVENPNWSNEGLRMLERPVLSANIGAKQQIFAGTLRSVSFDCELKGSGSAGTRPEFGKLLRACALAETIAAGTSVTYQPASSGHESVTVYYYQDGKRKKLTGARGTVSFSLETGTTGKASFTLTGHDAGESDIAMVSPTYASTVPSALIGVPFAVGGYSAVINALSIDLSNSVVTPPSMAAADGYGEIRIGKRDVNGSFDPEDTLVATQDWLGDLKAGSTAALTTGVIGSSSGNRYRFDLDKIYYRDVSPGDRDGLRTLDVSFGAVDTTGDDDIALIFT